MFECPYDIQNRNCKYYNSTTGEMYKLCEECEWYNKGNYKPCGIKPNKLPKYGYKFKTKKNQTK